MILRIILVNLPPSSRFSPRRCLERSIAAWPAEVDTSSPEFNGFLSTLPTLFIRVLEEPRIELLIIVSIEDVVVTIG
jgi:hypothetical protein